MEVQHKFSAMRAQFLNFSLQQKRKYYNDYQTLDDVPTWSEYYKQSHERISRKDKHHKKRYGVDQNLNGRVSIWRGNLEELEIDAIVNPTHTSLKSKNGVSAAIHDVAGPQLESECESLRECAMGGAKLSGGYKLPAKYVIHTVGCSREDETTLRSCYTSCLQTAYDNDLSTIAFPCISAGEVGYSNDRAGRVAMETVREWLQNKDTSGKITRVIFCLCSSVDVSIYEKEMQVYFPVTAQPAPGCSTEEYDNDVFQPEPFKENIEVGPGIKTRKTLFLRKVSESAEEFSKPADGIQKKEKTKLSHPKADDAVPHVKQDQETPQADHGFRKKLSSILEKAAEDLASPPPHKSPMAKEQTDDFDYLPMQAEAIDDAPPKQLIEPVYRGAGVKQAITALNKDKAAEDAGSDPSQKPPTDKGKTEGRAHIKKPTGEIEDADPPVWSPKSYEMTPLGIPGFKTRMNAFINKVGEDFPAETLQKPLGDKEKMGRIGTDVGRDFHVAPPQKPLDDKERKDHIGQRRMKYDETDVESKFDVATVRVEAIPMGIKGQPIQFCVHSNYAGTGVLSVKIIGRTTSPSVVVTPKSQGRYNVEFTAEESSPHYVHIKFNGTLVPGSPFLILVSDPIFVTTCDAPRQLEVGKSVTFEVKEMTATTRAFSATLDVKITDESGVAVLATTTREGAKHRIQFTPECKGNYTINIRLNRQHIYGSPFSGIARTKTDHTLATSTETYDMAKIQGPPKNWQKGQPLGEGGYGQVYICYDTDTGRELAVKEMNLDMRNPDVAKEIKLVVKEIELLRSLRHKRIVQFLGWQAEYLSVDGLPKRLSIFMEYMPGGSIRDQITQYGALSETVTAKYTVQILEGLEYLHELNIIHRDIKGANVLRDPSANVKLADFGCSKVIERGAGNTVGVGTWYWMSPDMLQDHYDNKTDIWSLGCTVVEMITEKPPWTRLKGVMDLLANIVNCDHPDYKLPVTASMKLKTFLQLCFKKNPTLRPAATELLTHPFCQLRA